LGNGELASLAYGSFKELLKFKELYHIEVMVLRTWEHGFLSILGDPLRVLPVSLVFCVPDGIFEFVGAVQQAGYGRLRSTRGDREAVDPETI
jgi:hypothetical protein